MRKVTILLLAMGFVICLYNVPAGKADKNEAKGKPAAEVFKQNCQRCHGEQGKGDGPATKTIKSMKMEDWTNKEAMAKFSDEDLSKIIREGGAAVGKSKLMPAYKDKLKDQEVRDLVAYIRSFAKK